MCFKLGRRHCRGGTQCIRSIQMQRSLDGESAPRIHCDSISYLDLTRFSPASPTHLLKADRRWKCETNIRGSTNRNLTQVATPRVPHTNPHTPAAPIRLNGVAHVCPFRSGAASGSASVTIVTGGRARRCDRRRCRRRRAGQIAPFIHSV